MLRSVLLLLLVSRTRAYHFCGTTMTYHPGETRVDGSVSVILRYKLSYVSCSHSSLWLCRGNCGNATQSLSVTNVDQSSGDWCQREGIITHVLPNNSPPQLVLEGSSWVSTANKITSWRAVTAVELKNRSDNNKPNSSPQTTVLPILRLPSNCKRNISLLAFDPDGDEVKCRYGSDALLECASCTPPSVLSISPNCSLEFNQDPSSDENSYAVQMVMEDFPKQTIVLTHTNGSKEVKTTSSAISKIPIQFLLRVVPAVPSCSLGLYVPILRPPTPKHGFQINSTSSETVEISVVAEANESVLTGLLFSGPHNVQKITLGSGHYVLRWTPSDSEVGQSHPICYVVQANYSSIVLHSEFRCVVVTVQIVPPTQYLYFLKLKISTTISLENKDIIEKLIKDELIKGGLPSHISVRLLSNGSVKITSAP